MEFAIYGTGSVMTLYGTSLKWWMIFCLGVLALREPRTKEKGYIQKFQAEPRFKLNGTAILVFHASKSDRRPQQPSLGVSRRGRTGA